MSTYCISDIHGWKDKLDELLEIIHFDPNKDRLYLLGDYVDWGIDSIGTLFRVMELDKHDSVTCLMGNHDKMMLDVISNIDNYDNLSNVWIKALGLFNGIWMDNKGKNTLLDYAELGKQDRDNIRAWLNKLVYFVPNVEVNNRTFYLCHSKPYVRGMSFEDVVWQRIKDDRLPRQFLDRADNPILVSGHTIVAKYNSYDEDGKCKIYKAHNDRYINIDCGAKAIGMKKYARLACICLDDLSEYYVE